ncbi:hypothetical protein TNCV_3961291, partial [Trichonephila clavipes]
FTVTEDIGERNTEFHYAFKEGKDAQGNLTASCKRLISWFLLYKETELGRKIVPVRPAKSSKTGKGKKSVAFLKGIAK